jgi:hypothetical protein
MSELPYILPEGVHETSRDHDGGFLERLLPHLKIGEAVHEYDEIMTSLSTFPSLHNRVMLYSPRKDNLWLPNNYAYNSIEFDQKNECFMGNAYSVTGWDNTLAGGQRTSFLKQDGKTGATLVPYYNQFVESPSAIALIKQPDRKSANYFIDLVVGNCGLPNNLEMPDFGGPIPLVFLPFRDLGVGIDFPL